MIESVYVDGYERVRLVLEQRLEDAGFEVCDSLAGAQAVITYNIDSRELEEKCFGEDGFVQSLSEGSYLIDLSPTSVGFVHELSSVATVHDINFVEAPIVFCDLFSSQALSCKDTTLCYIAGNATPPAELAELFGAIVSSWTYTGTYGTAQLARCGSIMRAVSQLTAEIEMRALTKEIRLSLGDVNPTDEFFDLAFFATPLSKEAGIVLDNNLYTSAYTIEMLLAELATVLDTADDVNLILPQTEAVAQLVEVLSVIGGIDKSPTALALVYQSEEESAEEGLDWTLAEKAYGSDLEDEPRPAGGVNFFSDDDSYSPFDFSAN